MIPIYLLKIFHLLKLRSVIGIKMSQQWYVPILSVPYLFLPYVSHLNKHSWTKFKFFVYIDFPRSRGKGDSPRLLTYLFTFRHSSVCSVSTCVISANRSYSTDRTLWASASIQQFWIMSVLLLLLCRWCYITVEFATAASQNGVCITQKCVI